jgi:2-polyprenyl-3-methyl-5-hydroxy-6-metoxy-1,4-benzoquinol methylase
MTTRTLACALCGGALEPSARSDSRLDLLECGQCGHVMSRAAAGPDGDEAALQQPHFGDAFADADDWWTRALDRANGRRVSRWLAPRVPPSGRVLEIGPGRGAVLSALVAAGYRVQGLELSPVVARRAAAVSGVPVVVSTLEQHARAVAGEAYDAVVGRHVLEHMKEPAASLAAIRRLLRPGGIVHLAVPNIGAPEAALPGWTGYQPYHLHYFKPATLAGLLRRHGFAVLVCRTREPFSGWTNAVVNSLRRSAGAGTPPARPRRSLVGAYNTARAAIGAVTWPVRLVQQWSGYGEEIEILARRAAP